MGITKRRCATFSSVVRDGQGNIIARTDSNINTVRDRQGNIIARIDGTLTEIQWNAVLVFFVCR